MRIFRFCLLVSASSIAVTGCSGGGSDSNEDTKTNVEEVVSESSNSTEVTTDASTADATMAAEKLAEEEAVAEKVKAEESAAKELADAKTAAEAAKKAEAAKAPVKMAALEMPASFKQCAACHTTNKGGEDKLGPNLWGIYGQKAGQGSFSFTDALKDSDLAWNDDNLDKWLQKPRALVPGNRMSYPGTSDAAKRKEIIEYLKGLK